MNDLLLGFDIGGHSVRCLLADAAGGQAVVAVRPWEPVPAVGAFAFDLDMDRCWRLLGETAREALAKSKASPQQVRGIAVTGMRFGLVLTDADGRVLFAAPNRDARAAGEASDLAAQHGDLFNARTGHWPLPIFTGVRLRWLAEAHPQLFARAAAALSLSDWVGQCLTGETATTPTHAGETLAFGLHSRAWAWDLVDLLGLPRRLFPPVVEAGQALGRLTPAAADAMGLVAETPVAVGGADTQCGLLGAGVLAPGQMGVIAGSTSPLQLVTGRPCVDAAARVWAGHHVIPGAWVVESNAGDTGEALLWLAQLLYPESRAPVGRLFAEARRSGPAGSAVLSTFGASVMNAREMSLPVGTLALSHMGTTGDAEARRGDLELAVLEGMAYAVKANADQLLDVVGPRVAPGDAPDVAVHLAGGMSRSPFWTQMVCDVLGTPLAVSATPEASALGAAVCAGVGAGVFADLAEGAVALAHARTLMPDPGRARSFAASYADWQGFREAGAASDEVAAGVTLQGILDRSPAEESSGGCVRPLRILATADLDAGSLEELRRLGEVTHVSYRDALRVLSGEDLVEELQGYDVLITEADVVDVEALRELPGLRVVAACRGQAVNVDVDACTALGIPVLFAPGRNAAAVADLAVALMLALARKLVSADAFLRSPGGEAGDMGRQGQAHAAFHGRELGGMTVGLVGLGAVGRAVARRVRAFGARVLVYDPYAEPDDALLLDAETATLDDLLEQSDLVSLHAAVTDETRGLIGAEQLARMKPGACLVNTARAALVDEEALAGALRSGHLGGAGLDVFSVEPPGADHPLLALPNVIGTPHLGGNTVEVASHQGHMIAADLRRLVSGGSPSHVLNPEVLSVFGWDRSRPELDHDLLDALACRPGPSASDLQPAPDVSQRLIDAAPADGAPAGGIAAGGDSAGRDELGAAEAPPATPAPVARGSAPEAPPPSDDPLFGRLETLLQVFIQRAVEDPALAAFAAKRDVVTHYIYSDLGLEYYIGFQRGLTTGGMGPPPRPAEVRMKAKAETFDGILTGKVSGQRAAMSGKLSFQGDVRLAMGVQKVQRDLIRLYTACRDEVGGVDFAALRLSPAAAIATSAAGSVAIPAAANAASGGDDVAALAAGATAAAGLGVPAGVPGPGGLGDEIVGIVEELYSAQLLTATGGNISAREPGGDTAWITPSQLFKGALRSGMLVRIDLEGDPTDPDGLAPSSEKLLHTEIYKARPDVTTVIHAHAPYATILALSGIPFVPVTTEAAFVGDVPRVPFIMPGTRELAVAVARTLGDGVACLMQNHGLVVVGSDLRHTANMVEAVERASQLIWSCHAAGKKPATLPKDVVETLREIGKAMA